MTLIVAIVCSDGVVIAADSASTDQMSRIRQSTDAKIRRVREFPIAFGGSGDVGLLQKIFAEVSNMGKVQELSAYRAGLKRRISPIQQEAVTLHVAHPLTGGQQTTPMAGLLIVGITRNNGWILEIDQNCTDTVYDEKMGNFHAIGSGAVYAHAYFRPYRDMQRDCDLGQIFAYRILQDSINVAIMGLAEPIHIHTIKSDSSYQISSNDELKKLSDTCELWRQLERETVGRLISPPESPSGPPEIPTPIQ